MRANDPLQRQAIRAALRIHDHLAGTSRLSGQLKLPCRLWDEAKALVARLDFTVARDWRTASESLLVDLDYKLRHLRSELDTCYAELRRSAVTGKLATAGEIAADLLALNDEFDGLAIDLQQKQIHVQTDPIVLEETALGCFQIALQWDLIGQHRAYEVIAETPRPPNRDAEVTHPHVREQVLCEGDGGPAIRKALREGRLLDFFTLVRQVLETYNPGSAYVQLDRWDGVSCHDCGYQMPGDDYGNCDRCEESLCSDCSCFCQRCERYVCNGCRANCEECDSSLCEGCLQVAADSGRLLCPKCFEQVLEEESDDSSSTEDDPLVSPSSSVPGGTALALDALCLVEAPVPA